MPDQARAHRVFDNVITDLVKIFNTAYRAIMETRLPYARSFLSGQVNATSGPALEEPYQSAQ